MTQHVRKSLQVHSPASSQRCVAGLSWEGGILPGRQGALDSRESAVGT